MTLYYTISDVIDLLEEKGKNETLQVLVDVTDQKPASQNHTEDIFALTSVPKLLDLRKEEEASNFASLIQEVPLYNINLELILDHALTERHKNARVANALNQSFGNQPLPNTMKSGKHTDEGFSGNLQHPMLGHMDKTELCKLYIKFLKHLDREQDNFGFERNILGKHTDKFLERFDGFANNGGGKVKALILIAFGHRLDHDPSRPMEVYVEEGQKAARKMNINDAKELVWAWLEADNYQMRRCIDIDRIMQLEGLPKTPNWIRTDIFCCLEKEAMKQFFADSLRQQDPNFTILENSPLLKRAIELSGKAEVDESLQQLLSQVLGQSGSYSGTAAKFSEEATIRRKEAKIATLV